jgi:hypothetical protein
MTDTATMHHDDHASAHDDDHGEGHGHEAAPLGPIDLPAWGAGIVGFLIAAVTAAAFAVSTGLA